MNDTAKDCLCVCVCVCVCVLVAQLCPTLATPWTVVHHAPVPWDFPGRNTGVGCHSPSPGDLPEEFH